MKHSSIPPALAHALVAMALLAQPLFDPGAAAAAPLAQSNSITSVSSLQGEATPTAPVAIDTPTDTASTTPSETLEASPTTTETPADTASPTLTTTAVETATATATLTDTATPTASPTPSPSPTPSATPTATTTATATAAVITPTPPTGDLDLAFGGDGVVTTNVDDAHDSADYPRAALVQPDGKIVVAGWYSAAGGNNDYVVARYEREGNLDVSFGGVGLITTDLGSSLDYAWDAELQSDGRIILAGYTSNGKDTDFALVRYNSDGSLDPTFGRKGVVTTDIGGADDFALASALQADGKIILVGAEWDPLAKGGAGARRFALVRYNPDGSLDFSFGGDGKVLGEDWGTNIYLADVAVQPDGKVVAVGAMDNPVTHFHELAVARYNADGSLDPTFGGEGLVTTDLADGTWDDAAAVGLQPDGRIVVAGAAFGPEGYQFALARYNLDGSLDVTFGGGGKVVASLGGGDNRANALALQADGKLIVAGWRDLGDEADSVIARYQPDGALDESFGNGGVVVTEDGDRIPEVSNPPPDYASAMALQPDGRIVVAQQARDIVVARYLGVSVSPAGAVGSPIIGAQTTAERQAVPGLRAQRGRNPASGARLVAERQPASTPIETPTDTPTDAPTDTATAPATPSETLEASPSATETPTDTPSAIETATGTDTATPTETEIPATTATETPPAISTGIETATTTPQPIDSSAFTTHLYLPLVMLDASSGTNPELPISYFHGLPYGRIIYQGQLLDHPATEGPISVIPGHRHYLNAFSWQTNYPYDWRVDILQSGYTLYCYSPVAPGECSLEFQPTEDQISVGGDYTCTPFGCVDPSQSLVTIIDLDQPPLLDRTVWSGLQPKNGAGDPRECPVTACADTQGYAGDPINTRTGGFDYTWVDLSLPTTAGPLVFQRTYASPVTNTYTTTLGYGWTHNQDTRLITPTMPGGEPNTIWFKAHSANQYRFADNGNGTYTPYNGVLASLVRDASSTTYTLTNSAQAVYVFDATGKVTKWTDPAGHSLVYSYTTGLLGKVSDLTSGRNISMTYDVQNRLISVKDHANRQVSFGYSLTTGDLITVTDVLNQNWLYTYDTSHRLTNIKDPNDAATPTLHVDYDLATGRAWKQYDGLNKLIVEATYTGNTATITNTNGITETHTYNDLNTLTNDAAPLGSAITKTYDLNFRPAVITDSLSHPITLTWDASGANLTNVKDTLNQTTQLSYDQFNNLTQVVDARTLTTSFAYTGTLLTVMTDTLTNRTLYTYTTAADAGQPPNLLKAVTDALGRTTAYQYNPLGETVRMTDTAGVVTTYGYDTLGRVVTTTVNVGTLLQQINVNQYDAAGRVVKVTRNYTSTSGVQNYQGRYNLITLYGYDAVGNQTVMTDTVWRVTQNVYDNNNRLLQTTQNYTTTGGAPSNQYNLITVYGYNDLGLQVLMTDTVGRVTRTEYDALNRPVTVTVNYVNGVFSTTKPDEDIQSVTQYDSNGNVLTTMQFVGISGLERKTYLQYDALNRPVTVTTNYVNGEFVSTEPDRDIQTVTQYDANGNVISTTAFANIPSLARTMLTEYDPLNRPISTTVNYAPGAGGTDKNITSLTGYNAIGAVVTTTEFAFTNLVRVARTGYDPLGRPVTTTANFTGSGAFDPNFPDRNLTQITTYGPASERAATTELRGGPAAGGTTSITTTFGYDNLGRLITTTWPLTGTAVASTTVTYDPVSRVVDSVDPLGHITRTEYDALDRPVTVTVNYKNGVFDFTRPDEDLITVYAYDAVGNPLKITDPKGNATQFQYDLLNRLMAVTDAISGTTRYGYDAAGNVITITDALTHTLTYTYDLLNRPVSVTDPLAHVNQYAYDAAGNQVKLTDANGKVITSTYDLLNRLVGIDYPDPEVDVTFTYDKASQRTGMTDTLGATTWAYDGVSRPLTITQPFVGSVIYGYDSAGDRLSLKYPDGKVVTYTYDLAARLVGVKDWQALVTNYVFDSANRLTSAALPNGITSTYGYDGVDRLTVLTHQSITQTLAAYAYTLDAAGNRAQAVENVQPPSLAPGATITVTTTADEYDTSGSGAGCSLREATRAANTNSAFGGCPAGGSAPVILAPSGTYTLTRTGSDDTTVNGDLDITRTVTLNGAGVDLTIIKGGSGWTDRLFHVFTATVQISGVTIRNGNPGADSGGGLRNQGGAVLRNVTVTNNTADADGNGSGNGGGVTNGITVANTLIAGNFDNSASTKHADCSGTLTSQGYNLIQSTTGCTIVGDTTGNQTGVNAQLGPLAANGGPTLTHAPLAGSPAIDKGNPATPGSGGNACEASDQRLYGRPVDGDGNGSARCDIGAHEVGATPVTLITYTYDPLYRLTAANYSDGRHFRYTYDAVGNRLTQTTLTNTTVYTYDVANRLTNVGAITYTWDANGNLLNDGVFTYTYNSANRPITITQGVNTYTFAYNGLSDRFKQVVNGVPTTYTLDLNAGLTQVLADGTNTYLYGNGRIAQYTGTTPAYFLGDALGSVRQLTNASGAVTLARSYDPYGNALTSAGSGTTNYNFVGEWRDNTGLLHLRARYYGAQWGRFLTADSWGGDYRRPLSLNKWNYTEGNPVNYTDPSGQFLDTVLDIGFVAYDVYRMIDHIDKGCDTLKDDLIALGLDAAGFAIPFVTGLGAVRHVLTKVDDVSDLARLAGKADVFRYAPAINYGKYKGIGSGLTRTMQHTLVNSLDEGGIIATRSRPYLAHLLDANPRFPAKGPEISYNMLMQPKVVTKYDYGVRTLLPEYAEKFGLPKVLSDLDIAGYTRYGKNIDDPTFLLTVRPRFNKAYHPIITHGTLVNGLDDPKVVTTLGPRNIQNYLQEPVWVWHYRVGYLETLSSYAEYEAKYIFGGLYFP